MNRLNSRVNISCITILLVIVFEVDLIMTLPCKTSNGNVCIFPFVYNGKMYSKCTFDTLHEIDTTDNTSKQRRPWCAYNVSLTNSVMQKWDFCDKHCSLKTIPWWIVLLAIGVLMGVGLVSCLADYGGYLNACRKIITSKLDGRRRRQSII